MTEKERKDRTAKLPILSHLCDHGRLPSGRKEGRRMISCCSIREHTEWEVYLCLGDCEIS